jgi:PAS domain-containing protein
VVAALLSDGGGGTVARRYVPVVLIGLPFLGWLRLRAEQVGLLDPQVGVAALVASTALALALVLLASARSLDRAETARRESALLQQRLVSVVEQSEDAIFTTSLEGDVTSWNAGAERLYGYTAEEVIGQSMTALVASGEDAATDGAPDVLGPIARHRR